MLTVCRPGEPPVTVLGWFEASATNRIRFAAVLVVEIVVNVSPLLTYWFESHTYGVRPVKRPKPPRIWERRVSPLLRSQLAPIRGDHILGAGTTSVA